MPVVLPASPVLDTPSGLTSAEAAQLLALHGPNELAGSPPDPLWRRFVAQFRDLLVLILIAAAFIGLVVSRELKTPIVVLTVVLVNAVVGVLQERRAERSLDALGSMMVATARVRRDGVMTNVPAAEVVPGDLVAIEAGDRVPADGRWVHATTLEADESALTGESRPVAKRTDPAPADAALGDKHDMGHLGSTVTRGRGELLVTATGMATEMGRIAGLLQGTPTVRSPLQRQLDRLAHGLAALAGVVVAAVVVIGLLRGEPLGEVLLTAVALAVASIPEGLPAVTAITLAIGVAKMAERNAIVKRLASVETLGCTSVICSDKTGTLTLNQMTVEEVVAGLRAHPVSGRGWDAVGQVERDPEVLRSVVDRAIEAFALCNDAVVTPRPDGTAEVVGDPTEAALAVLATKAAIDVAALRDRHPRTGEVPFDSARKLMVTHHDDDSVVVKGAYDVLIARTTDVVGPGGELVPAAAVRDELDAHHDRLAATGRRVLAVGRRSAVGSGELADADGLTLLGLVGISDPPRPQAAAAIAEAQRAGIRVMMITGDHAATAGAIGQELGLRGTTLTGAELDRLDDAELDDRLDDLGVVARVSPEHKLRLVTALQRHGQVVAMTGDGVNDAPALRRADIGVAMGITGTAVSKEAATMVLADDDIGTIVAAVRQGRAIYDNIVAFVRFQLSTSLAFAMLFLLSGIFGVAEGEPFTAIAILWVNIIMDGPPAMALGLDPAASDVMDRSPRPADEPILTRQRWSAVALASTVMAGGTFGVLAATGNHTMAFATFVLFQFVNLLEVRSATRSVFHRTSLHNRSLWLALVAVLGLQVAVTHLGPLQRLFGTTSLSLAQWGVCAAVACSILVVEELRKAFARQNEPKRSSSALADPGAGGGVGSSAPVNAA